MVSQLDGFKVMFWGCFSKHAFGFLKSIVTVDSNVYLDIIQNEIMPELEAAKEQIGGNWRIMQDNAPCHTAIKVKEFLTENEVEFIKWPPYSPDLNPIENVWSEIKRNLMQNYPVAEFFSNLFRGRYH